MVEVLWGLIKACKIPWDAEMKEYIEGQSIIFNKSKKKKKNL